MFLAVRDRAFETRAPAIRDLTPGLTDAQVHQLATYAIAGADGLFVAKEVGGDSVDLRALFRAARDRPLRERRAHGHRVQISSARR
jgi:hypothetical protein